LTAKIGCGELIGLGISMAQLSFHQAMFEQISGQRCWKISIHFTRLGVWDHRALGNAKETNETGI